MASENSESCREVYIEEREEEAEEMSPQEVASQFSSGEFILKKYKCLRGSHVWEQFHVVFDPTHSKEVFGIVCCSICKVSILYTNG